MTKMRSDRLAKTVAGDPAELNVNVVVGNGTLPLSLRGTGDVTDYPASPRDGLVSVLQFGGTQAASWIDRTSTASLAKGSLIPGSGNDYQGDAVLVLWYHFEG